jgi:RimJ/RimL family protein N-acetyltransferase
MSNTPALCIQVNEETQLRLLEERHVVDYFTLIERNKEYLHAWIDVEAYEGSLETLKAYVKQRLLQFVNSEGYHLGIWYQEALIGIFDYRLNWKNSTVELGYWLDEAQQGRGIVTQACLRGAPCAESCDLLCDRQSAQSSRRRAPRLSPGGDFAPGSSTS